MGACRQQNPRLAFSVESGHHPKRLRCGSVSKVLLLYHYDNIVLTMGACRQHSRLAFSVESGPYIIQNVWGVDLFYKIIITISLWPFDSDGGHLPAKDSNPQDKAGIPCWVHASSETFESICRDDRPCRGEGASPYMMQSIWECDLFGWLTILDWRNNYYCGYLFAKFKRLQGVLCRAHHLKCLGVLFLMRFIIMMIWVDDAYNSL